MKVTKPAELTEVAISNLRRVWSEIEEYEHPRVFWTYLSVWTADVIELLYVCQTCIAIWLCYFFPFLILRGEDGRYFGAADEVGWYVWLVSGWRLSLTPLEWNIGMMLTNEEIEQEWRGSGR